MSAKILIVDDETNVRLNYRITLETEGHEIFEAASAANALEQMVERTVGLAILAGLISLFVSLLMISGSGSSSGRGSNGDDSL